MRTVLFIALGTLAAFVAGLAGTYVVLPMVAPEVVEAQQAQADSLAADPPATDRSSADRLMMADSLAMTDNLAAPDSLALDSTGVALSDTSFVLRDPFAMRDSLAALRRRLAEYEAQIGALEAEIEAVKARRVEAGSLAGTLVKLEDRELSRVLDQLDLDVLELLYAETSARDRARLLGALDPARTAVFIRRATSMGPSVSPADEAEPVEPVEPDASSPR